MRDLVLADGRIIAYAGSLAERRLGDRIRDWVSLELNPAP
jgi:hypothetical protein